MPIFYHGSSDLFDRIDLNMAGRGATANSGARNLGSGFYAADAANEDVADNYAPRQRGILYRIDVPSDQYTNHWLRGNEPIGQTIYDGLRRGAGNDSIKSAAIKNITPLSTGNDVAFLARGFQIIPAGKPIGEIYYDIQNRIARGEGYDIGLDSPEKYRAIERLTPESMPEDVLAITKNYFLGDAQTSRKSSYVFKDDVRQLFTDAGIQGYVSEGGQLGYDGTAVFYDTRDVRLIPVKGKGFYEGIEKMAESGKDWLNFHPAERIDPAQPSLEEMRDRLMAQEGTGRQGKSGRMKPEPGTGSRDPHAALHPIAQTPAPEMPHASSPNVPSGEVLDDLAHKAVLAHDLDQAAKAAAQTSKLSPALRRIVSGARAATSAIPTGLDNVAFTGVIAAGVGIYTGLSALDAGKGMDAAGVMAKEMTGLADIERGDGTRAEAAALETFAGVPFATLALDHYRERVAIADVPQPLVTQFIAAMPDTAILTQNEALNAFFAARGKALHELKFGRDMGAKVGNMPISEREAQGVIQEAARAYLAHGGTIEEANAYLAGKDAKRILARNEILDIMTAAPDKVGVGSDPGNAHLRALRDTKIAYYTGGKQDTALYQQMMVAAGNYMAENKGSTRDAVLSYYKTARIAVSQEALDDIAKSPLLATFDGVDGSRKDGIVSAMEYATQIAKLGLSEAKIDSNHDTIIDAGELHTALCNPQEYRGR